VDDLDRELLNILQAEFPLETRPYRVLAERLGTTEPDVVTRVNRLVRAGIIRKIGPIFDTRTLGYTSMLAAMRVPRDRLAEVAAIVSSFPEVTHNYGRHHEYNLWFTLVCRDSQEIERVISEIRARTGGADVHLLPAERMFKIGVSFEF